MNSHKLTFSISGSAKIVLPGHGEGKATELFRKLQDNGFELSTGMDGDYLLCVDHNAKDYRKFIRNGGSPERATLLRLEPESVFPSQYQSRIERKYALIFSPGRIKQEPNFWIGWPYKFAANPNLPEANEIRFDSYMREQMAAGVYAYNNWTKRVAPATLIAANKVSPIRQENYSIRRTLAKEIPRANLQVYGLLWNDSFTKKIKHRLAIAFFNLKQGTLPNFVSIYGGLFNTYDSSFKEIDDKHKILRESKFSVVIENCNSYASEKLIDALINGCIPIYIGPKLKDLGLPENIAVEATGKPAEILEIMGSIQEGEVKEYLSSSARFLGDNQFLKNWTEDSVYAKVVDRIRDFFNI